MSKINTRIINKHDIEENWLKAENFIPMKGEIIIYDIDNNYSYQRVKIGDGETNVNNLPFINNRSDWSENDENSSSYIQNRTHWIELVQGDTAFFENISIEPNSSYYEYASETARDNLNLNGTYYYLIVNGIHEISQKSKFYESTEQTTPKERFESTKISFMWDVGGMVEITNKTNEALTVSIYNTAPLYHKIDKNFLPDDLGNTNLPENIVTSVNGEFGDITGIASESYVNNKIANLVDSSPEALNTLNELAAALGNDSNFATTVTNELANKVNKSELPNITKGDGEDSIVIGEGIATGDYSLASGTTDSSLVNDLVGSTVGSQFTITAPEAKGDVSIAMGASTKAYSTGARAYGVSNQAGYLGYYIWSVSGNTITLSTNQHTSLTSSRSKPNSSILGQWKTGMTVSCVNGDYYPCFGKITAVDASNGTITVDNIPFTELSNGLAMAPHETTLIAIPDVEIKSILGEEVETTRPIAIGEVEFGFGASADGFDNIAAGIVSTATGYRNTAIDTAAFVSGRDNIGGFATLVGGLRNEVTGKESTATGRDNVVKGTQASAQGNKLTALGSHSHIEGNSTNKALDFVSATDDVATIKTAWETNKFALAKGNNSHVEGGDCMALGDNSHAHGTNTIASGGASTAIGQLTEASGAQSYAEGFKSIAADAQAHAEGNLTQALAKRTHTEGYGTVATTENQHVQGKFNELDENGKSGNYAHIVGGGSNNDNRKNIHTLDWNGSAWFNGDITNGNGESLHGAWEMGAEAIQRLDEHLENHPSFEDTNTTYTIELSETGKGIDLLGSDGTKDNVEFNFAPEIDTYTKSETDKLLNCRIQGTYGGTSNPGNVHQGYVTKIATITHTMWNADMPITFTIASRYGNYTSQKYHGAARSGISTLSLTFTSVNNTNWNEGSRPSIRAFKYDGETMIAYAVKINNETWELYVEKIGAWDKINILEVLIPYEMQNKITVDTTPSNTILTVEDMEAIGATTKASRLYPRIFSGTANPNDSNPLNSEDGDIYIMLSE